LLRAKEFTWQREFFSLNVDHGKVFFSRRKINSMKFSGMQIGKNEITNSVEPRQQTPLEVSYALTPNFYIIDCVHGSNKFFLPFSINSIV
jgi:hypothetical protein